MTYTRKSPSSKYISYFLGNVLNLRDQIVLFMNFFDFIMGFIYLIVFLQYGSVINRMCFYRFVFSILCGFCKRKIKFMTPPHTG